jgi:hypothetical protein
MVNVVSIFENRGEGDRGEWRYTFVMGHSSKDVASESVESHDEDLGLGFSAC